MATAAGGRSSAGVGQSRRGLTVGHVGHREQHEADQRSRMDRKKFNQDKETITLKGLTGTVAVTAQY